MADLAGLANGILEESSYTGFDHMGVFKGTGGPRMFVNSCETIFVRI